MDFNIHNEGLIAPRSTDLPIPIGDEQWEAFKDLKRDCPDLWTPDNEHVVNPEQPSKGYIRKLLSVTGMFKGVIENDKASLEVFAKRALEEKRINTIHKIDGLDLPVADVQPRYTENPVTGERSEEVVVTFWQREVVVDRVLSGRNCVGHVVITIQKTSGSDEVNAAVTETMFEVRHGVLDENPLGNITKEQALENAAALWRSELGTEPDQLEVEEQCTFYQKEMELKVRKRLVFEATMEGVDDKGIREYVLVLVESDKGEIVFKDNLRHRSSDFAKHAAAAEAEAETMCYLNSPDQNVPLEKQLLSYTFPGVPAGTTTLGPVMGMEFEYEDKDGKLRPLTANAEGKFIAPPKSPAMQCAVNAQALITQEQRWRSYGLPVADVTTFVQVALSSVRNNAQFLSSFRKGTRTGYALQMGVGSGGEGGLKEDLSNDIGVALHEKGHEKKHRRQKRYPGDKHEGGADWEMTQEFWARRNDRGLLTDEILAAWSFTIGSYAAGKITGASGKKGEIRNGNEPVSADLNPSDTHVGGLTILYAMGHFGKAFLTQGPAKTKTDGLKYIWQLTDYQDQVAPGYRTSFLDIASSGLNRLEKDLQGEARTKMVAAYVGYWKDCDVDLKKIDTVEKAEAARLFSRALEAKVADMIRKHRKQH